jgi:small subunit ribosomal protein S18
MSERTGNRSGGGNRRYFKRKRSCQFCGDKSIKIEYKNISLVSQYITREGKIRPRRQTGTCAKHQRKVAIAVKRARHMAFLPFAGESLR